jgi:hypothetical protein
MEALAASIVDYAQRMREGEASPFEAPPPGPRIGPNPYPMQSKIQDFLGMDSWAPNLPEGSYGLPPSLSAPTAGEGLYDQILEVLQTVADTPPGRVLLGAMGSAEAINQALGGMPSYEPGGGPERMASWARLDIPGMGRFERPMPELLKRTGPLQYRFKAPALRRFERLLEIGAERPAEWANIVPLLEALGGNRDLLLKYNRGWGAASPGTDFVQTTREANRALARYLERQPFTREWAQDNRFTNAPSKLPNLIRAYYEGSPLSGDKAEAMAGFMAGEPRIPIDRHALDAPGVLMPGGATEMKLDPVIGQVRRALYEQEGLKRGSLSNTDLYKILEDAYANGLLEIAPGMELRPAFAQLWEGVRGVKGLPHEGGVQEVLGRMGLFDSPGMMLNPSDLYGKSVPFGGAAGRRAAGFMK